MIKNVKHLKLQLPPYHFNESVIIKSLRKIYNLGQMEFCNLLGYSQSALSKIENGILSPDLKFVVQLAKKLEVDLNIFSMGHIPFGPQPNSSGDKRSKYLASLTNEGFIHSKTVFLLLHGVRNKFASSILKKIDLLPEELCLSYLKYNFLLIEQLAAHVTLDQLDYIIHHFNPHAETKNNFELIKMEIKHSQIFKIQEFLNDKKFCKYELMLSSKVLPLTKEINPKIIYSLFIFDLMVKFNLPVDNLEYKSIKNNFEIKFKNYA